MQIVQLILRMTVQNRNTDDHAYMDLSTRQNSDDKWWEFRYQYSYIKENKCITRNMCSCTWRNLMHRIPLDDLQYLLHYFLQCCKLWYITSAEVTFSCSIHSCTFFSNRRFSLWSFWCSFFIKSSFCKVIEL